MKIFADYGQHRIFHGSCLEMLNASGDMSVATVVADWPFSIYNKLLPSVMKESFRVLEEGGTFISVIYPDLNYHVRKESEQYNFNFAEEIVLPTNITYLMHRSTLHKRLMGIMSLVKGPLEGRKWSIDNSKADAMVYDSTRVTTNFWNEKNFKNGFKNQLIGKHSEAMPRDTVDEMFNTIIPKEGKILDLFGGAGTIFIKSIQRSIPCDSSEIEETNCRLMNDRLRIEY